MVGQGRVTDLQSLVRRGKEELQQAEGLLEEERQRRVDVEKRLREAEGRLEEERRTREQGEAEWRTECRGQVAAQLQLSGFVSAVELASQHGQASASPVNPELKEALRALDYRAREVGRLSMLRATCCVIFRNLKRCEFRTAACEVEMRERDREGRV